jgi:hypothetical protein
MDRAAPSSPKRRPYVKRGGIIHHGGNSWAILVTVNGKQKHHGFKSDPAASPREQRKQAEAKRLELLSDIHRGEYREATKLTTGEWLQVWLTNTVRLTRRPRTVSAYTSVVASCAAHRSTTSRFRNFERPMCKPITPTRWSGSWSR